MSGRRQPGAPDEDRVAVHDALHTEPFDVGEVLGCGQRADAGGGVPYFIAAILAGTLQYVGSPLTVVIAQDLAPGASVSAAGMVGRPGRRAVRGSRS
ncbi:MAG TPA: hypothetical protein VM347_40935 [Nonomuraea sp.]|nr:hypothetical protein [Nonomuraea sp.]